MNIPYHFTQVAKCKHSSEVSPKCVAPLISIVIWCVLPTKLSSESSEIGMILSQTCTISRMVEFDFRDFNCLNIFCDFGELPVGWMDR